MTYLTNPNLAPIQKQIITGTILGGSSIIKPKYGRNCYLAMRDRNMSWLKYKIEPLNNCFKQDESLIKMDKNTFRCVSYSFPIFNEFYEKFYRDGKKHITKEVLEPLDSWAWMVWFCDAGRKSKRKVYLRTHKFGELGTQIIADYFNSLDVDCETHLNRNRWELIFTVTGSQTFLKTIAHRLPKFILKNIEDIEA